MCVNTPFAFACITCLRVVQAELKLKLRELGGGGVIEDTTYLMNIADKILLALKFELTQKYSANKSQHC